VLQKGLFWRNHLNNESGQILADCPFTPTWLSVSSDPAREEVGF